MLTVDVVVVLWMEELWDLGKVVKRPGTVLVISWNSQLTVSIYCSRLAVENEGWCRLTFRSASSAPLRGIIRQKIHGSS